MELKNIRLSVPEDSNIIVGQTHFIKTIEDLYEAIATGCPHCKFGIAFCEASGPTLLRVAGNDQAMTELAKKNGMAIAAGHSFIIFIDKGFPVSILNVVKNVPEVCSVFCATANPTEVINAETDQGRAILGVVDGFPTKGVENEVDAAKRKELLRMIGYKL